MRLVPLIRTNKREYFENEVRDGGEGIMLKDLYAKYESAGRPRAMYKVKRFEEVDAWVSGFQMGDEASGWRGLVGALEFSCHTETGKIHMVAVCSNLTLEDRKAISCCARCASEGSGEKPLLIEVVNDDGHNRVTHATCPRHGDFPGAVLRSDWYNRVAEVRGQEFAVRVFRLTHAVIERWREPGADGKTPAECKINLAEIQARSNKAESDV
jgi:ATP-dependent DNA ligase